MISSLVPGWATGLVYVFLTLCTLLLILRCYKAIRRRFSTFASGRNTQRQLPDENNLNENVGLASAVIRSLPSIQFREEIKKGSDKDGMGCTVCLGEFAEGEWLRLLPNCNHAFHVSCIDTWFRSHSTCPLCRMGVSRQESPLGHFLLESVTIENPEFRLGAMRRHTVEIDSDELVLAVSPNRESTTTTPEL